MKGKDKIDIVAKLILILFNLKEEKNKVYSLSECEKNIVYLFNDYSEFRSYFELNVNGNIDDELLELCIFKRTNKGTIIACKGLCDYTIGLMNSKEEDIVSSLSVEPLEESNVVVGEIKELGDENAMVLDKMIEEVKKDESSIEVEKKHEVDVISSVEISEEDKKNKNFIKSKYDLLLQRQGIILLEPMAREKRHIIYAIVKEYADMTAFSLGHGELKYVVLRYKPYVAERKNVKEMVEIGNTAYKEGDYDTCINYYLQLLQFGKPRSNVYAKLGLSYMQKNEKDIAIEYLTVANVMSKEEGKDFDYDDLIAILKDETLLEDRKPRFKMQVEEFVTSGVCNYGIDNIDDITTYILNSGLDVVSACLELGMSYEQIDIVRLIYARDFYYQGNDIKGDQFLKSVEMSKNKTKFTLTILEEIRKNKKIYINRSSENTKVLSLTLQPNKYK